MLAGRSNTAQRTRSPLGCQRLSSANEQLAVQSVSDQHSPSLEGDKFKSISSPIVGRWCWFTLRWIAPRFHSRATTWCSSFALRNISTMLALCSMSWNESRCHSSSTDQAQLRITEEWHKWRCSTDKTVEKNPTPNMTSRQRESQRQRHLTKGKEKMRFLVAVLCNRYAKAKVSRRHQQIDCKSLRVLSFPFRWGHHLHCGLSSVHLLVADLRGLVKSQKERN